MTDDVNWISVPEKDDADEDEGDAEHAASGTDPVADPGNDPVADTGNDPASDSEEVTDEERVRARLEGGDGFGDDADPGTDGPVVSSDTDLESGVPSLETGSAGATDDASTGSAASTADSGSVPEVPTLDPGSESGAAASEDPAADAESEAGTISSDSAGEATSSAASTDEAAGAENVEQRVRELIEQRTEDDPGDEGSVGSGTTDLAAGPAAQAVDAEESVAIEPAGDEDPTTEEPTVETSAEAESDAEGEPTELRLAARTDDSSPVEGGDGVTVESVADPPGLRSVLTGRRVELVASVMVEPPSSIRALADRLGRDVKDVHGDLHHLAEFGVVEFDENGRAKQPTVPYDRVSIRAEITPGDADE